MLIWRQSCWTTKSPQGNSPPPKEPLFSYPKNKFFFKKNFLKKIFWFFAWIFFDKLAVKVDRSGVRMLGGRTEFLFKGIVFVFWQIWGTYIRGWIFCSKELPLFLLTGLGYVCRGGILFKGITFVFLTVLGYVCRGGGGFFVQTNCLWFLRFFCKNSRHFSQRIFFVFEKF